MTRKSNKSKSSGKRDSSPKESSVQATPCLRIAWLSLLSTLLLWMAFPPLSLGPVAFIASLGWLLVIESPLPISKRGYFILWLSGCAFWLPLLHGIRLAYWPLYFGWLAISLYLAIYIPLFVFVARRLRTRLKLPLVLAAPVSWVAFEFVRSYMLTGYGANMLAHTQIEFHSLMQISDQLGGYGVSYLVMTVTAVGVQAYLSWPEAGLRSRTLAACACTAGVLVAAIVYGQYRLAQADELADTPPLARVLLVQENTPTYFDSELTERQMAWTRYLDTTRDLAIKHGTADMVVWPESTFTGGVPWFSPALPDKMPSDNLGAPDEAAARERLTQLDDGFAMKVDMTLRAGRGQGLFAPQAAEAEQVVPPQKPYLLVGCDAAEITSEEMLSYNAALFFGPSGEMQGHYYKMHRVMFGEYIPLGVLLKPLRDVFNIGIEPGTEHACFEVQGTKFAPNICFESMLPRLISNQVRQLTRAGTPPDVLVNLSNDSWFRGSSMLEHHLACTQLAAIENRRPILVAANTGLSASIDGSGRLLEVTDRLVATGIMAEPTRDSRSGLVQLAGYPLAWLCTLLGCLSLLPRRKQATD